MVHFRRRHCDPGLLHITSMEMEQWSVGLCSYPETVLFCWMQAC